MNLAFTQSLANLQHVKFRSEPSQHTLFLDPIKRTIYSIETQENIIPEPLSPEDLLIITIHNPIQESLVETLLQGEKAIEALFGYYIYPDGWCVETGIYLFRLRLEILNSIAFWWRPEYWFMHSIDTLQLMWAHGHTAKQIIALQYLGQYTSGMVDETEAIEWLEHKFREWQSPE
jgi:hypothetical protein